MSSTIKVGDFVLLSIGDVNVYYRIDSLDPIRISDPDNPNNRGTIIFDNGWKIFDLDLPHTLSFYSQEDINALSKQPMNVVHLDNLPNGCVSYKIGRADEDRYDIAMLGNEIMMYAVYDGHGGKTVADYLKQNFAEEMARALENINLNDDEEWKSAIENTFIKVDQDLFNILGKYSSPGSTATIVFKYRNKLYIANVGDSRAIVFDSITKNILYESPDHNPNKPSEKSKIEAKGGRVMFGRVMGILAVSRAFGDFEFKESSNSEEYDPRGWVSVVPDIAVLNISLNSALLMASDGLWHGQYMDSSRVIDYLSTLDSPTLCDQIATEARRNYSLDGRPDDVVVLFLPTI